MDEAQRLSHRVYREQSPERGLGHRLVTRLAPQEAVR
ncbi:MAG: hypothetical protein IPL14_01110 [Nitrospira sp.]|nr:hypothetical protein [Nitrospira sp.]